MPDVPRSPGQFLRRAIHRHRTTLSGSYALFALWQLCETLVPVMIDSQQAALVLHGREAEPPTEAVGEAQDRHQSAQDQAPDQEGTDIPRGHAAVDDHAAIRELTTTGRP